MLVYNPAYDIYHGAFRQLALFLSLEVETIEFSRLRIYDFYLVFPQSIDMMNHTRTSRGYIKRFKEFENKYNNPVNYGRVFSQMLVYQQASFLTLKSRGYVDTTLINGEDTLKPKVEAIQLPEYLLAQVSGYQERNKEILDFIGLELSQLPFFGASGLKGRTNLIPSKYDSI